MSVAGSVTPHSHMRRSSASQPQRHTTGNHIATHASIIKLTRPRWLDKADKAAMEQNEEWQTCPSASCGYGRFLDQDSIFICQLCKASYCVPCKVPMHSGETCQVYHERLRREEQQKTKKQAADDRASDEKVKQISRICPGCGANIDKFSGCDHVTCTPVPLWLAELRRLTEVSRSLWFRILL